MAKPLLDRALPKITVTGECWLWTGARKPSGYGQVNVDGRTALAHRAVYEALVGPIPDGLELDHTCETPCCVNPAHLQPVTRRENLRWARGGNMQKATCPRGHEYDYMIGPKRRCRTCEHASQKRWRQRRKKDS